MLEFDNKTKLKLENEQYFKRKISFIDKIINEFSLLRLTTMDSDSKEIYNKNIIILNDQKIKIQKFKFPK